MNEKELTAKEYFEDLKSKKQNIQDRDLKKVYENCLTLLNKYTITGQVDAAKKLIFHLESIEKEREIVKKGIDTFVYLDDIKEFIEKVPDKSVKCIEMSRFEREIPDEIVLLIADVKPLFDEFFIVFTDYTKEHQKKAEKERDPILFGMFKDSATSTVIDRMYFIGDWEDEYCDLTLDKMVNEAQLCLGKNIERTISTPKDIQTLKEQLNQQKMVKDVLQWGEKPKKKPFQKIRKMINGGH